MSNRMTMCASGLHELTECNVRQRTGARAGIKECLACQREGWARNYQANSAELNHVRSVRLKAKKQGLKLRQTGRSFAICRSTGMELHAGDITSAEGWLDAHAFNLPPGPKPIPIPSNWVKWIELFVDEQNAAQLRKNTIDLRVKHLSIFARRKPDCEPLTVNRGDLVSYLGSNGWHPQTVHGVKSTFKVFFRFMNDQGYRDDDPARSLPRVRISRRVPKPAPERVVQDGCAAEDPRVALAVRTGAETGLRRGELAALRPDNVHGSAGQRVLIIAGKGGHQRTIPISDDLAETLLSIDTEWVFPSRQRRGQHLSVHQLGAIMRDALEAGWTPHTLRHRFATVAYQATGDLRAVQELLGHASPVTTAIYTRVGDDAMRRAAMAAQL